VQTDGQSWNANPFALLDVKGNHMKYLSVHSLFRGMTATFTLMLFFTAGAPEKASAQQANRDVPQLGAPDATYSPNSKVLPVPELKFGGVIKYNAVESKPWWPPRVAPPKGAPNILLIMTDDVGFGAPSTFGGVIPTPALDRIAAAGLRYTNFHSRHCVRRHALLSSRDGIITRSASA
jgi:hypothetical protein